MKKVLSILLFVVAIAMIGSGVYIMNSNKYLFSTALDGVFNYLVDGYNKMNEEANNSANTSKYKITTETSLKTSDDELATVNGELYVNAIDKQAYINLDSKFMKEDFVSLEGFFNSEKVYIKIKEIMENFYYTDFSSQSSLVIDSSKVENADYSQLMKLEDKEISLLANYLKKSILKDLKDNDFKKSVETLTIEGKSYKTSKLSLGLSEKEVAIIVKNFLTEIYNDNNAIKVLQKVNKDITKEAIKELLDSFNPQNLEESDELEISFYIENFTNVRRIEFGTLNSDVDSVASDDILLRVDLLENESFILSIIQGEKEVLKIKNENTSKTQSKITVEMEGYVLNGTYTSNDKNSELNVTLLLEGETVATVNMKNTTLTKNREYKVDLTVEVKDLEMTFVSNNTIILNEDIPEVDVEDAKDMEELTEEEQAKLTEFIQEKMEQLGLSDTEDNDI